VDKEDGDGTNEGDQDAGEGEEFAGAAGAVLGQLRLLRQACARAGARALPRETARAIALAAARRVAARMARLRGHGAPRSGLCGSGAEHAQVCASFAGLHSAAAAAEAAEFVGAGGAGRVRAGLERLVICVSLGCGGDGGSSAAAASVFYRPFLRVAATHPGPADDGEGGAEASGSSADGGAPALLGLPLRRRLARDMGLTDAPAAQSGSEAGAEEADDAAVSRAFGGAALARVAAGGRGAAGPLLLALSPRLALWPLEAALGGGDARGGGAGADEGVLRAGSVCALLAALDPPPALRGGGAERVEVIAPCAVDAESPSQTQAPAQLLRRRAALAASLREHEPSLRRPLLPTATASASAPVRLLFADAAPGVRAALEAAAAAPGAFVLPDDWRDRRTVRELAGTPLSLALAPPPAPAPAPWPAPTSASAPDAPAAAATPPRASWLRCLRRPAGGSPPAPERAQPLAAAGRGEGEEGAAAIVRVTPRALGAALRARRGRAVALLQLGDLLHAPPRRARGAVALFAPAAAAGRAAAALAHAAADAHGGAAGVALAAARALRAEGVRAVVAVLS
jgi:hypothetical protein